VVTGSIQVAPTILEMVPWTDAVAIYNRLRDQPNSIASPSSIDARITSQSTILEEDRDTNAKRHDEYSSCRLS
jgi:hypothetical protein